MRNAKPKAIEKELTDAVDEQATGKSETAKKKKKTKQVDEALTVAPKVKKVKSEKGTKEKDEAKNQKAVKDDKLTKFLVSMKKSVRKSLKKEAAEVGVSMNEYIVLAVEEKLNKASLKL